MPESLPRQAEELYQAFSELVRGYQFRDREGICCHGLSVSQCYTLEALDGREPATMSELAGRMYLEVSSMTRVVDRLVAAGLAERAADPADRRVCRVRITPKGRDLLATVRADLLAEHEQVLRELPADSREAIITAMNHLLAAFRQRQERRCE
ncbi:MAG: MarR family winged helix-turn-helix transcriptional regulator [Planctomycetota bacterium]|jgi:DNA-binding MarR family transcriptional regulator